MNFDDGLRCEPSSATLGLAPEAIAGWVARSYGLMCVDSCRTKPADQTVKFPIRSTFVEGDLIAEAAVQ